MTDLLKEIAELSEIVPHREFSPGDDISNKDGVKEDHLLKKQRRFKATLFDFEGFRSNELDDDQSQDDRGDKARNDRALSHFNRVSHSDTSHNHHSTGNRRRGTTQGTGQEGQGTQVRDVHAEGGSVRRDGFVKGERGGVTGTGDRAQEPRTQRTTPTSDVIGFTQNGDEGVNQTGRTQTLSEHASGDDDT